MAVLDTDVMKLRRMIADPEPGEFDDAELMTAIATYPLTTANTYDLNAAARDLWEQKAALYAGKEERFTADGASFEYGSLFDKAMKMRMFYASKVSETYRSSGYAGLIRDDVDPYGNGAIEAMP